MKAILRAVILLFTLVLLAGCFSVSTTINLNKDGSGTIEEKVLVKPMNMFGQTPQEPESIYDEEELKSEAAEFGEGVKFQRGEELSENGMNGYLAIYKFDDINKLKLNRNYANKAIDMDEFAPSDQEDISEYITFDFDPGSTATLHVIYPEEEELEEDMEEEYEEDMDWEDESDMDETSEEMMAMMKEMYSGMKFSMKIKFNGKIKETNAMFQEGDSVILLDVDFEKLVEDPELMTKMNDAGNMTQNEMQELMKNIEGMKVETQEKLKVEFN